MFIATLYVFPPGHHFPLTRQCFVSCRWWNSASSVVIVSVEVYLYVFPGGSHFILCIYMFLFCVHWSRLFIIDFTQLSTQLRAGVRCTIIEHAAVVLLQIHVFCKYCYFLEKIRRQCMMWFHELFMLWL